MDYEIQGFTKHCTATGREITPGEWYYSVVLEQGTELVRCDYSMEAWNGPPEGTMGYWKSQVPDKSTRRKHWAPNDVILNFFDELGEQPDKQDIRYVLTLLLIRRRVFRQEEEHRDEHGKEELVVYCPRRDATYAVPAVMPEQSRVDEIQEQLATLLQ